MSDTVLELAGVSAWYGHAQALFGLDLVVGEGETVALLGRNGAGKTTTMRSVMGILVRRTGKLEYRGQSLIGQSADATARKGIGWVPDDRRIFPNLTVRENLQLVQSVTRSKDRAPLTTDEVIEVLPIMERLIGRKGSALSGGEQQAVAIARALVGRPRLLLLDEPTEGLAPVIVRDLADAVAALPGRYGISVLVAEQNLSFVRRVAQRVYVLDTGRLVHEGDVEPFLASPELQERYLSITVAGDSRGA